MSQEKKDNKAVHATQARERDRQKLARVMGFSYNVGTLLYRKNKKSQAATMFYFQDQKALFECNDSEGHSGQFVYIRDDREDKEYFGMCEVEVFEHKG